MTLIIEDGSGLSTAESYASIEQVNGYITKWHGEVSEWADKSEAEKESALRQATRYIDSHRFMGLPRQTDQALQFPRYFMGVLIEGKLYRSDEIPDRVINATIEAVIRLAKDEELLPDHEQANIKRESETVGPLATEVEYVGGKKPLKTFTVIDALLKPFVIPGGSRKIARSIG